MPTEGRRPSKSRKMSRTAARHFCEICIMKYAIVVAYDGTNYRGWQTQKNGISVQSVLEKAAEETFGKRVNITASGRTDSGVHAAGQVCHFSADTAVPAEKIADALNFRLPADICVLRSASAPEDFDSNRSAKKKTYCYRMYCARREHPLKSRYALAVYPRPDIALMQKGAALYCGEHDFKAYCASGSTAKTTVRTIFSAEVSTAFSRGSEDITFTVCGGGFLYNMVRTMAGTLLYLGQGRISLEDVRRSLDEGNRALVGKTMPAKGLTLESVEYSPGPFA